MSTINPFSTIHLIYICQMPGIQYLVNSLGLTYCLIDGNIGACIVYVCMHIYARERKRGNAHGTKKEALSTNINYNKRFEINARKTTSLFLHWLRDTPISHAKAVLSNCLADCLSWN